MQENRDVAVLSITVVDVVLSTVPSFAHHVVGTHSRQGNTGRPHSEAARVRYDVLRRVPASRTSLDPEA